MTPNKKKQFPQKA